MSTATLHSEKKKTLVPQLRFREFDEEWKDEKLLKHVHSISSGKIKPSDEGEFLVYGSTGIIGKSNIYTHEGDYILVARVGANAGQINRAKGKYAVTDNTLIVDLKEDVSVSFCESFLTKFNLNKLIFGSGQPLITGGLLKAIDFIFPTLPEQQKIASFLSAVDEKIQQLSRKKELLSQYKKGVMQQLFSGKLRFKDENGKDYADWEEKLLGSLTERNICYGIVQPGIEDENGVKFIRGGDVFNGCISRNLRVISKEITDNYKRTYLKGGELIMSLVGYPGETAIVPDYLRGSNLARQVGLIDLKRTTNSVYVHYYISSSYGKRNLLGKTIGSAQQVINIVDLKKLKIPLPSLLEQQKIANFLSSVDAKIESTSQQINQTQSFKKGLLQQMFV